MLVILIINTFVFGILFSLWSYHNWLDSLAKLMAFALFWLNLGLALSVIKAL